MEKSHAQTKPVSQEDYGRVRRRHDHLVNSDQQLKRVIPRIVGTTPACFRWAAGTAEVFLLPAPLGITPEELNIQISL
jgi:hypothetical protein